MRLCSLNTHLFFCLTLILSLLTVELSPFTAEAKKDDQAPTITVRYSYEKQTRDRRSRYVLVPTVQKVNAQDYADQKKRFKALFISMKNDKKANYGKTGFNVDGDVVLIFLDETKKRNDPFIMAETIYTFTENGARGVRFPRSKYDGKDYTRRDVTFPSYRLILPYWEGLPPHGLKSALLSLGDGALLTSEALEKKVLNNDNELIAQLVKTLKEGNLDAVKAIVATSTIASLEGIEEGFIALLQSAQSELRSLGIKGLDKRKGKLVFKALREVMDSDPSSEIKDQAAVALSQSKDPKIAVAALFHNLRSKDTKIAVAAAEKLSNTKSKEATPELILAINRSEPSVRQAVIKTLTDRKAIKDLVKQLNAELPIEVKIEIAQAIKGIKSGRTPAYHFLVTQPNSEAASEAIRSLRGAKIKGDVAKWFEKALRHPDASTRIAAAETLLDSKGTEALKVLSKADIEDSESGEEIHDSIRSIYENMSDKVILNDCARQSTVSLKSAATGALGKLHRRANKKNRKKAFKAVGQLAQSPKAWVRAEAARSLGDIANDEAKALLIKLKEDKEARVKWSVARSASAFDEESMRPLLVTYLKDKNVRVIENALISLGKLKSIEALSDLFTDQYLAHKAMEVRRAAMTAVAALCESLPMEKREKMTTRISLRLSEDTDSIARRAAAKSLAHIPTEESGIALSTHLQDKDAELVKSIVDALVKHAIPQSTKLLEGAMDHREVKVRAYAYQKALAIEAAGLKKVVKGLFERRLKMEEDPKLKATLTEGLK